LLQRALAHLERLADSPRGAIVLFASAVAVYAAQAVAWPLNVGRDLDEYLYAWIQLFDSNVLLPWSLLFRGPATPVLAGALLDPFGGALAEPALALLFAGSIVAWAAAARWFGARSALLTALALLAYPGYGAMFHELASETVFAATFALWALLLVRATFRPSTGRFVALGLVTALLVLARPGNAVLLPFALFPLLLQGAWRSRAAWAAAMAAAALLPLAAWAIHNGVRFGEWKVARGGNAVVPFYRAFLIDRIVSPDNGPTSRKLGAAVREHLLTRDPYKSYGVTEEQVFSAGSPRVHEDMYLLSDEVFGWDTDYSVLRDAALEGIRARPWDYATGVLKTVWLQLSEPYYHALPAAPSPDATEPATVDVDGKTLPRPSEGQLIPGGQNLWISRPDNSIREVWTSATEHHFVFAHPEDRPRFERVQRRLDELFAGLPQRDANATLALRLNQLSRWYPRLLLWLAVGLVALAIRRPRLGGAALLVAAAALLVVGFNALAQPADRHFVLPVAPALVLLAAVGLLGRRSGPIP
jgi:hypothetical protein